MSRGVPGQAPSGAPQKPAGLGPGPGVFSQEDLVCWGHSRPPCGSKCSDQPAVPLT